MIYIIGAFLVVLILYLIGDAFFDWLTRLKGYSSLITQMTHIGGIPNLQEGTISQIGVKVKEDHLLINDTHRLPLNQIKSAKHISELDFMDKHKLVLKRAEAGGLLMGPAAAIVGGILGKQSEELHDFLSIDFLDREGQEHTALFLLNIHYMHDKKKFIDDVNYKIGYTEEKKPAITKPYDI